MKNTHNNSDSEILRQKAEELLKLKPSGSDLPISELDMFKLIHELEVHQIELEMQNEEHMLAKEQLAKAATDKYAELYDFAPTGYYTLSKEGAIIELNLSGASLLGKERSLLRNSRFGFFISEDTRSVFNLFFEKVFRSKTKETCEAVLSTYGNSPMTVHLTGIVTENGKQCLMSMVDITESKHMIALKESKERLHEVLENSLDVSYKRNLLTNTYDYLSSGCMRVTGYSHEYLMNLPFETVFGLIHPDDLSNVKSLLDKASVSAPGLQYQVEYRFKQKQGEYHWFYDQFTVMHDATGKPVALIGSFSDITERKKFDAEIAALLLRHQTIIQTTTDGVHIIDSQGGVKEANPAFCSMLGYTREELFQLNASDWDAQWTREQLLSKVAELMEDTAMIETKFRHKDGSIIEVEINATGVTIEGQKFLSASARDITEKKRAKKLLQQTRENYETFFDTIDDFLWVLDLHGNIININSTVIERLGYTRDELIGKSVLMVHPSERRDESEKIVGEMLNGITEFCPVPIMTKSGIQIPVETRVSQGFWNGNPVIFGVTKDITKIKLSEEKFSKLFHLNPSACGLSDIDNHEYIEVNEAFYNLFGFDKTEVIGKTAIDLGLLPSESIAAIMVNADSKGVVINAEASLRAKNGDVKNVLLSAENIHIQDKKYRFTVAHDITGQKQTEEALRESEQKFKTLADSGQTLVWASGTDKLCNYFNSVWTEFTGRTPEQEMGYGWTAGIFQEDLQRCVDIYATAFDLHENFTMEYRLRRHDGEYRWIEDDGCPSYNSYGEFTGYIGHCLDITERRHAAQEIKLINENLLKLNAEKDKFFSIMAHDLRSPFNGFLGLTRLMVEDLPSMRIEEVQKIALSMRKSATNLYALLENLLEWSRMKQGLTTFESCSFLLMPEILQNVESLAVTASLKGIEINYDLPDNFSVFADKNMFGSLMRNLISNAVKFSPRGGNVKISSKSNTDGSVEIAVKDSGIGMNEKIMDNLFCLDENTNRKGTEGEPSTGLGLVLCKEFIEKHGGKLWLESEVGIGSTFYFMLPPAPSPRC